MECVYQCPGLAIFGYDLRKDNLFLPNEYEAHEGAEVYLVNNNGEILAVNQNVWFNFIRREDDYFLESENVASSTGSTTIHPLLERTLPNFYLKPKEPFYFSILRLNISPWQFYTSRSPSVFCRK